MSYVAITTTYYVILLTTLGLVACYGWYRCANDFQAMRTRVAELERDSNRYRWLRGIDATASVHWHDDSADDGLIRDLLDAAIDSAMGAKP